MRIVQGANLDAILHPAVRQLEFDSRSPSSKAIANSVLLIAANAGRWKEK